MTKPSILPDSEPYGKKSAVVDITIYKDGSRVMYIPSGFKGSKIVVVERPDYQLNIQYKS